MNETPKRGGRPPTGDPVIERAFALLTTFDADHRAQPLADLARRSGIPRSSALRLARTLVDVGALERLDDGRFVVGLHLLEIASLAPRGHGLRAVAMPFMEDLFHVTRQHVLLAVREENEALLVERLSARDAGPVRYRVGGRLPLTSTGVSLVLLAHAPADVQDAAIDGYRAGDGENDLHTPADLRRALAEVRRGGYAYGRQRTPRAMSTVAAPIRASGEVVAALSVVAPSSGFEAAACGIAVRAAARAVSRQLSEAHGPVTD
ncbi:transcriptional regulator [Actinoplanes ianthinogenes]|uniref:Transcriptional regulator n=1 Tax=Actinoplanes ianthinogenes TaxID=122358 RepID=A0ABM7M5R8_9ACTN|nr:IclR family transcriptional regulator [Actinoplanes ianthinogenes]BCJ46993.1 transcriptional regulator [Actinoplanes ianthinogenes]GGR14096.1 transcriptional regulator [Actinoplanes ianthinogenes]